MSKEFPKLNGRAVLAPMEEVSNLPFRMVCRGCGAAMAYTEQVSALALQHENKKSLRRAFTVPEDAPCGLQLFGRDPHLLLDVAKEFEKDFSVIDLNFGCPSKKIVQQGYGAALLKEKGRVREIVHTLSTGLRKPLTVKMRSGFKSVEALSLVKVMEQAGVSAVTIHARTREQGYSGRADWSIIKQVKDAVGIPVIGNGDVRCEEDAARGLKETGCEYVMVGRAARDHPLLFKQINHFLEYGEKVTVSAEERLDVFWGYMRVAERVNFPVSLRSVKEVAMNLSTSIPGSKALRQEIVKSHSCEEVLSLLDKFKKHIK